MRLWNLLFIPAIGAGSIVGAVGRKNAEIKVNGEKLDVNPTEFDHSVGNIQKMVGVNLDENKDNYSKGMRIILPCWKGNLLSDYEEKEKNIDVKKDKFQQHIDNFKGAWKSIVDKIKDILNKTYGCSDVSDLKMRIGVIDFEKMKESGTSGMVTGEIKKIDMGRANGNKTENDIKFVFNYLRNSAKVVHNGPQMIELYDADIGGETVKKINKMFYEILKESARLTLKKYKWKKEVGSWGNKDVFSAERSESPADNKRKIQKFETGGVNNPFELSQWCFSNLDECTKSERWNDDKLLEFLSGCHRNRQTGGEYLLSEFVEQVKEIIKGNNKNNGEECGVWEKGMFCSKGGLIYKK
ncbi:hypothetical protein [Mycoplasma parvum]|uniref:Uncharacterized protein n=1 Tax=Mycoplasma parvum str. Indiana TaxID=1403316 RepID=U5NFM2_9MOLU|nr:hypothetical protein [Mycoplasma parvum]AGX88954.1 hypothetical protein PRV_00945 [Mycoplasma parvum str. Indiana]